LQPAHLSFDFSEKILGRINRQPNRSGGLMVCYSFSANVFYRQPCASPISVSSTWMARKKKAI